jgi:cytochrome c-type biogenesis protein CcmH
MGSSRARLLAVFLLAAAPVVLAACGPDTSPSLEERAQSIDRTLICPVCPGETIDQAQVELARQMRTVVREKLAEGMTRDEVLRFFVERYGESVLAAPPKEGFNLVAWIVPIVAVAIGAAAVALVVRAMRTNAPPLSQVESPSEEGLEEYLAVVDLEVQGAQGIPRAEGRDSGTGPGPENG